MLKDLVGTYQVIKGTAVSYTHLGNDYHGYTSQGMKQLMAGAGVAVVGMVLVPLLSGLFSV